MIYYDLIVSICRGDSAEGNIIEAALDILTIIGYLGVVAVAAFKYHAASHPVVKRYYLSTGAVFFLCATCGYFADLMGAVSWYFPVQLILHFALVIAIFYFIYYKISLKVEA